MINFSSSEEIAFSHQVEELIAPDQDPHNPISVFGQ